MKKIRENEITVFATNTKNSEGVELHGFTVYLDYAGTVIPVKQCRHNALLFEVFRDGIRLNDLRRLKPGDIKGCSMNYTKRQKNHSVKLEGMVRHLLEVIDYIIEDEFMPISA